MATYGHAAPAGGLNGIAAESWLVEGKPAKVIIACSYLFIASFAPTWGPASWVYPPELFPLRVRGKAVALVTSANWAFNFALGYFVPPSFQNIKWKTYIVFGVFCACMFLHVTFMFPETAGKSLEEVKAMFTDPKVGKGRKYLGTPPWRTHVVKRALDVEPLHEKVSSEVAHIDSTEMTPPNSTDVEHRDGVVARDHLETV